MRRGQGPAEAHEEERGRCGRRRRGGSRGGAASSRGSGGGGGAGGGGGGMARALTALLTLFSAAVVALGLEPDFLYPLENVTIAQGRDAMFTCVVNNLGGYRVSADLAPARTATNHMGCCSTYLQKVAWIKADTKAILAIHEHVITNNARLSVTHNDFNTWTLNLRDVKREDRGQYMCQVNTDPMKSQTAFLEVVIPPDIIYEETSGDIMVPEGGNAKLACKARGYPKPKVVWKREDGGEIILRNAGAGKTRVHQVEGEMLSLSKVTRSEMGAYLCIAANGVPPSVSKRMMVHVHFHPMIQVPNQLVGAPQGTDVTLHCHVEASPKAINYWTRDTGEMIIANEKYNMSETSSSYYSVQMRLTIRKFRKADFGGYKCISKNSIGDAEGNIRLYEMELNERKGSALDRDDLDNEAAGGGEDGDDAAGQHLYNGYQGSLREAGDASGTALGDADSAAPGPVGTTILAAVLTFALSLTHAFGFASQ